MSEAKSRGAEIFLVDDHPAVRQGLTLLFSHTSHNICGEAESIGEMEKKLAEVTPDIVMVDLSLENESGFDLLAELKRRGIRSLVYSMHGDAGIIEKAFRAGANGYVTKRDASDSLLEAVAEIMAGRRYTSPRTAQSLAEKVLNLGSDDRVKMLSNREQVVLRHLSRGNTTNDIAHDLNISPRTVESYYARIIEKLKLDGMKALRKYLFGKNGDTRTG